MDEATQTDFLDTEVQSSVNLAYHDVVGAVMEVYEAFYETTTAFTYAMVKNQQEYTIDSSLIKVTRVEINYNPSAANSKPTRCIPIASDELRRDLANTNSSGSFFNASYYLHGNLSAQKIGFVPIPTVESDTGTTKSISVWGIQLPADLSASGDDVNVPYADRFSYLIALRAAAILLRKGQQEESHAARYMNEYEAGVRKLQTFIKERKSDDAWVIEDVILDEINFDVTPVV